MNRMDGNKKNVRTERNAYSKMHQNCIIREQKYMPIIAMTRKLDYAEYNLP